MNRPTARPAASIQRKPGRRAGDAPAGAASRKAALHLLDGVLRRGEPLDQLTPTATRALSGPDKALAVALASDALRWLVALDTLIDQATEQQLPDDAKARSVLRLALVQLLLLNTPPHAVIATSLNLLSGGPRRLVHALLSRIQREGWTLPDTPPLPPDVATRWQVEWGDSVVAAAQMAWRAPPPLDLGFRDDGDASTYPLGTSLAVAHRRIMRGTAVIDLPGYGTGAWWVQDLAASLPVRLLGPGLGRDAADLCAAPGGKTLQLAAAGWAVTAVDKSARRMERLRANLARCGADAHTIVADIDRWEAGQQFAAVLLDAPCSATGIFRRHPDVLHRVTAGEIAALAAMQAGLLDKAAALTAPGGTLVYATCSLERAEGEDQVAAFLARHPGWRIAPPTAGALPAGLAASREGWVRSLPGDLDDAGGLDGFFTVMFHKAD